MGKNQVPTVSYMNIWVRIFGDNLTSNEIKLAKSETHPQKFQIDQVCASFGQF
jgi:hypothetical protein